MGCSGLIVVLLLLGQVPPPALGPGAAARARSRKAVDRGERGGPAQGPGRAIGPGRGSSGRPADSRAAAPAGRSRRPHAFRSASRSGRRLGPRKRGTSRGEPVSRKSSRDRPRSYSSWPSAPPRPIPPSYALASLCLRAVLERQPDHREARRLLGYVPHEGGWARPFAVRQLRDGYVSHPTFGWVHADWVPHLDRGELPAPLARGQKKARWLSAAEANDLRANWSPPWHINTEHFEIQTNVTLAEAISLRPPARGVSRPVHGLARRHSRRKPAAGRADSKTPSMTGEPGYKPHSVYYFGSKNEYVDYLSPTPGARDRAEPRLLRPAQVRRQPPYAGLFLSRPRRPVAGDGHALSRGVAPVALRDGRAQRLHQERGQLLGLRGAGHLLRDRLATAGRLARGRRTCRRRASRRPSGPWWTRDSSIPLAEFVAFDQNAFNSEDRDLSPLPAGHGPDRLSHAVARRDLPRRIPRLRSRRLSRADQARHGPIAARPPRPAVRDPRQPVPRSF